MVFGMPGNRQYIFFSIGASIRDAHTFNIIVNTPSIDNNIECVRPAIHIRIYVDIWDMSSYEYKCTHTHKEVYKSLKLNC